MNFFPEISLHHKKPNIPVQKDNTLPHGINIWILNTHIQKLTEINEGKQFLTKLRIYENNHYIALKDQKIEPTQDSLTRNDLQIINNLVDEIQRDDYREINTFSNSLRDLIITKAFHTTPERLRLFKVFNSTIDSKEAISLVRMLAEIEIEGKAKEFPLFDDRKSIDLHEQILIPHQKIIDKSHLAPDASSLQYKPDLSKTRFILENNSAMGGTSSVSRALDLTFGRIVRIKKLWQFLKATESFENRTRLEAKTLAKLSNPHLPIILDLISEYGSDYMIMEDIIGDNLNDDIFQGKKEELIKAVGQLGSVVDYLDEVGIDGKIAPILHNDIKPGNLIWNKDTQNLKLYDFGSAEWAERIEFEDHAEGTPQFISPERAKKREGVIIDHKSDVYSVAATSFYLLTGQVPVNKEEGITLQKDSAIQMHILDRVANGIRTPLPKLDTLNTRGFKISENGYLKLSELFEKGMHLDPTMRYDSATEFAKDFKEALEMQ